MEDVTALQRTVRRCTAVIVIGIGLLLGAVSPGNVATAAILVVGGLFYLVGSAVYVADQDVKSEATSADGE